MKGLGRQGWHTIWYLRITPTQVETYDFIVIVWDFMKAQEKKENLGSEKYLIKL